MSRSTPSISVSYSQAAKFEKQAQQQATAPATSQAGLTPQQVKLAITALNYAGAAASWIFGVLSDQQVQNPTAKIIQEIRSNQISKQEIIETLSRIKDYLNPAGQDACQKAIASLNANASGAQNSSLPDRFDDPF